MKFQEGQTVAKASSRRVWSHGTRSRHCVLNPFGSASDFGVVQAAWNPREALLGVASDGRGFSRVKPAFGVQIAFKPILTQVLVILLLPTSLHFIYFGWDELRTGRQTLKGAFKELHHIDSRLELEIRDLLIFLNIWLDLGFLQNLESEFILTF